MPAGRRTPPRKRPAGHDSAPATSEATYTMDLTGRVVLITGGKRIGAAVAVDLASRGADIAIAYNRSEREAASVADDVRAQGRTAAVFQADLADPPQCRRLVDAAAGRLGRLDVLVNMASVYRQVPLDETD